MLHAAAPLLAAIALSQTAPSAPAAPAPSAPAAPAPQPGIPGLLASGATPQRLVTGFVFLEGPAADAQGNMYFTDVRGEKILRLTQDATGWKAAPIVESSGGCNGLMFTREGRLFACQMGKGTLQEVKFAADGSAALAPVVEQVGGAPVPGFNDLAITPDGGIYFTNMGRRSAPGAGGVYFTTTAGGEGRKLDCPVPVPNGTRTTTDGRTLLVVSSEKPELWAFPIEGPGKLGTGRLAAALVPPAGANPSGGDGFAVDAAGNIWMTLPGARCIAVIDPAGKTLGHIPVPEAPSNCAFGGADGRTLFITARTSVYAVPTLAQGWWLARGGAMPGAGAPAKAAPAAPASASPAPSGKTAGAPATDAPAKKP
ncbi:MAG: SMP-30/gluconolactonase/LRE family protein [Phycisphaerales bacterium]